MPLNHPVALEMIGATSGDVDEQTNIQRMADVVQHHTEATMAEALANIEQFAAEVERQMQQVNNQIQLPEATFGTTVTNTYITVGTSSGTTIQGTLYVPSGNTIVCGRGGLSPDSDYFLDGSLSCNDITMDVATFIRVYGFNLDSFLDNLDNRRTRTDNQSVTQSLMMTGRELRGEYLRWRDTATPEQRSFCGLSMLFGIGAQFSEYHWNVSDKAVIALILDGQTDIEQRVLDPAYLAQTVQTEERLANWCSDIADGLAMLQSDYAEADKREMVREFERISGPRTIGNTYTALSNEDFSQIVYDVSATTEQTFNCYLNTMSATNVINTALVKRRPKRIPRRTMKIVRQAVKRSADLFARHIGREQLSAFLKGEPFRIHGELFDYEISKTLSVIAHTADPRGCHIPYDLNVIDRDGDVRLCKLCVYFDKTPVLDQIVALAMFIRSGNEEEMLKKANAYDRCEQFKTHPKMIALGKARDPNAAIDQLLNELENVPLTFSGTITADDSARERFERATDEMALQTMGVTHRQHREEVVPWRIRTRGPLMEALAQMTNTPFAQFRKIADADRSFDDAVVRWVRAHHKMPDTLDQLIGLAF